MRLVDADYIKESVKRQCDNCRKEGMKWMADGVERAIIEELDNTPTAQPQWIPCSERLPNEDEEVLATSNYGILIALWRKTWDNKICWFETIESKSLHKVTAWMPLPEPYGGESE